MKASTFITFLLIVSVVTGCSLGNVSSLKTDADSNKIPSSDSGSTQEYPLNTNIKEISMYPGESFKLSVSGGSAPYTFEDVNNFFDITKYIFKLPVSTNSVGELLKVNDNSGQSIDINVRVKNFNFDKDIPGLIRSNFSAVVVAESDFDSNNNLYAVGSTGHLVSTGGSYTAVSNYSQIFKSSDSGLTWTSFYSGTDVYTQVMSISIDRTTNHIYIIEKNWKAQDKVLHVKKSIDGGTSWQILNTYLAISYNLEKIKYTTLGNLLVAGTYIDDWGIAKPIVLKSTDKGQTWAKLGEIAPDINLNEKMTISVPSIVEYNDTTYFILVNSDTYYSNTTQTALWKVKKTSNSGATWTDSDNFNIAANKDRYGSALTLLSNGTLVSVGRAVDAANYYRCIVRSSSDMGQTWATIDNYNYGATTYCTVKGVASFENVITYHAEVNNRTILRSGTTSFVTTDDLPLSAPSSWVVNTLVVDANNNIYIITNSSVTIILYASYYYKLTVHKKPPAQSLAMIYDQTWDKQFKSSGRMLENEQSELIESFLDTTSKIITKISTDQAQSWNEIESYSYNSAATNLQGLSFDNSKNLIMAAYGSGHWIVRKGQRILPTVYNWQTIDDFQLNPSINIPVGAVINEQNEIFVAGYTRTSGGISSVIVRKSDNSGGNFTTVDSMNFGTYYCEPFSIKINKKGEIFVFGMASTLTASSYTKDSYFIRKSSDNGVTWQTVKTVKNGYFPSRFDISPNDELFLVGVSSDNLIIDKGSPDGSAWTRDGILKLIENGTVSGVKIADDFITIPVNSSFNYNSYIIDKKAYLYGYRIKTKSLFLIANEPNVFVSNVFDCRQNSICFYGDKKLGAGNNGSFIKGLEK